jgi:hypothetical protein
MMEQFNKDFNSLTRSSLNDSSRQQLIGALIDTLLR